MANSNFNDQFTRNLAVQPQDEYIYNYNNAKSECYATVWSPGIELRATHICSKFS